MQNDYSVKTDEELISLYSEGVNEVLGILLERHKVTVRKIIATNNFFVLGGDSDDILQEGMIGLVFAIKTYESAKGVKFVTHASRCIKNQIVDAIRRYGAKKNTVLNTAISLDEQILESGEGELDNIENIRQMNSLEDTVIFNDNMKELDEVIRSNLSRLERDVYEMHLKGMKYTQIAEALGKDKKTVDNATRRMREKIRHILDKMMSDEA
ncbi:MAG: sigma-70 family RNA polymerase sigma factor [Lachnospiraceae bacterium]|nr:sigma-70 family RNA polymerase sigma factor [Lachnospiraceae bacterium]